MRESFPAFFGTLLDKLNGRVAPKPANISGIDVLLYVTGKQGVATLEKALCIMPAGSSPSQRIFLDGVNCLASPCVECIIAVEQGRIHVQDLAGLRRTAIDKEDFDARKVDCICRYVETGHLVFLDPVFDDTKFLKRCWSAFSSNMAVLAKAGLLDRDQCVRAALQVVMNLCITIWKARNLLLKDMVVLSTALSSLDSSILDVLNAPWRAIPDLEERLDEAVICRLMEQSIMESEKKRTGSYYTPRAWAWYTCHEALAAYTTARERDGHSGHLAERDLQRMAILDPAMGTGDFLDAMSLEIVDAWLPLLARSPPGGKVDWNALRLRAKLEHVFKHNLHGIDVSKLAVDVTRARFFLNIIKHVSKDPSLCKMVELFSINLFHDDFLTRTMDSQNYDIVIGNPPYLMEVRNNQALFRHYSKHPATRERYESKMDLFYFFMFKGIEILKDCGVMGFVVQEYWLDRFHARQIRQFMFRETTIVEFTLFKKCRVFQTAPGQHSMIIVAQREKASADHVSRVIKVKEGSNAGMPLLGELLAKAGDRISIYKTSPHLMYDAGEDKVFVEGDAERGLFKHMHEMRHYTLREKEIQVGINIPQPFVRRDGKIEGVFVIHRDLVPRIAIMPEEQALIKPFHKATDIGAYTFETRESQFIIFTTNENMRRVEQERETYVHIRAHLDRFADDITSDHKPYGLHRPRQPEWFESRVKIIGVRKTRAPKFAVVPQDYYMDQAALFIRLDPAKEISPYYACAFLNSPVASRLFSGIKTQGGQLQIDKSVLAKVPIPACHEIDHLTISHLSEWLHVFAILKGDRKALDGNALSTKIRGIIDGFFDRLVLQGGDEPILAINGIGDLPRVSLADHLIKRRSIDEVEHVMSTVIDVKACLDSILSLLPALVDFVDRLASRVNC
ncbi:MAG: Eco57I restriction-modification methylase domain-containing protein [Candidatus Sigynarchaeum springense]